MYLILMKGFGLKLFFPTQRESHFSKFDFFDPCPMEGTLKSLLSVCMSINLAFLSEMGC